MSGGVTGKGKGKGETEPVAGAHGRGRESPRIPAPIDDAILRDYLADALHARRIRTGRKGTPRLGRVASAVGRSPREPSGRPVAHPGGDLASFAFDLPESSATR